MSPQTGKEAPATGASDPRKTTERNYKHSVQRPVGCLHGCPLDRHEPSCVMHNLADRPPVEYADTGAFVLRDGVAVFVSLAEYNAIHDGVPSIPRQRAA